MQASGAQPHRCRELILEKSLASMRFLLHWPMDTLCKPTLCKCKRGAMAVGLLRRCED
jgi:hypothetical protein